MNTKINERKNIIISLKSNLGETKKGIEKRIRYLKVLTILNLVLAIFSVGIIILSILSELFENEIFKWQKTALLAILSISFVLNLPKQLYELKLLKHLKKINSKSEFDGIDKLNSELKNIIDKLNNGLRDNWFVIILAVVIMIMGIYQLGNKDNTTYWNYMKLPILIFYGIIAFNFIITNKKLTENINKMESNCS